ncbi:MAG: glycosyltransferase [Rhodothermales bacterium]|nr:glycosyltransferase [Rhodothermales bacterium]
MIHAFYQQLGGEDRVFEAEADLLTSRGHAVDRYTFDNHEIDGWSTLKKAASLVWNREAKRAVADRIRAFRPDVLHVQNTFPGLSPSVYAAATEAGVPVIQKLCNYRLFCANGLLFRNGSDCQDCIGKRFAWRAAVHGCYRGDRVMSGAIAGAYGLHHAIGTWSRHVGAFLTLDEHGRELFVRAGLPPEKLHVKPNFLDPFPEAGPGDGEFALFVGRVAPGKGVETLIRAWALDTSLPLLKVVGDGPLMETVREMAAGLAHVEFLGRRDPTEVETLMGRAAVQIVPSEFQEPFGRVALEAMGTGTPVLSTQAGALRNVVQPGVNGQHFEAGNPADLLVRFRALSQEAGSLRPGTRENALSRFSGEANLEMLLTAYRAAGAKDSGAPAAAPTKPAPQRPPMPPPTPGATSAKATSSHR